MHREGYWTIIITSIVLLVINALLIYQLNNSPNEWIAYSLAVLSLLFYALILNFFRNPHRYTEINPKHIIAPCDGKVVVIEEVEEPIYFKGKCLQVSIFMSPLNVHVNRNPVSGKICFYRYFPGKYLFAWHPKSSTENEQTFLVYETQGIQMGVKQIAGALARRIKCYVKEHDPVTQGGEFGFIKFGSRVDLLLPTNVQVKVNLDEKTIGGETVIAHLP